MAMNWLTTVATNGASAPPYLHDTPFEIDHTTADFMKILFKLSLADQFVVTEIRHVMWDVDLLMEVNDVVGYNLWYTE